MKQKIIILFSLLLAGSAALICSLFIAMPDALQWSLLGIGIGCNAASAIGLMVIGWKNIKGTI